MKYLPYIYIPMIKWLANMTLIMVVFGYIFPSPFSQWVELIMGLSLSLVVAMVFGYWALRKNIPHGKDLAVFIGLWLIMTALMEMMLSYYSYFSPLFTVLRYEFAMQLFVEVIGLLALVLVLRRQRAYSHLAEGINLES
ncbi:MAG TPA: hypothetical protein PLF71_03300 [bacterium]|nr:MAG: hypothetical protein BWY14_00294 [Parcubacteria group bacterium ADurb.Bin192]HPN15113.1 hypothetical protein [bacterium]